MEGRNSKGHIVRVQSGYNHIFMRGNSRFNVFYDEQDKTEFLARCQSSAQKFDTKILSFALMDNHIHLLVFTNSLSKFVNGYACGYAKWYNKKYGLSDKLFKTPFGSACKNTEFSLFYNTLYILNNPIKAGICSHPADYKWSSYHFHFSKKNSLASIINVDTSFIDNFFPSVSAFDQAIINFKPDMGVVKEKGKDIWPRIPDNMLIKEMNRILNGKNLFCLDKYELDSLIETLWRETSASMRQIASITHLSYEYVRSVCHHPPPHLAPVGVCRK
jgi:putative transposase